MNGFNESCLDSECSRGRGVQPESMEWFIEGQAFSSSHDMAPSHPPPPFSHQQAGQATHRKAEKDWQLAVGWGRGGGGGGTKSKDCEKAWSSINPSILSGSVNTKQGWGATRSAHPCPVSSQQGGDKGNIRWKYPELMRCHKRTGLWIRIGFNADPDPAFYLSADPDPDPGSQTNAEPSGSGSRLDFKSQKVEFFYMNNILKGGK